MEVRTHDQLTTIKTTVYLADDEAMASGYSIAASDYDLVTSDIYCAKYGVAYGNFPYSCEINDDISTSKKASANLCMAACVAQTTPNCGGWNYYDKAYYWKALRTYCILKPAIGCSKPWSGGNENAKTMSGPQGCPAACTGPGSCF